LELVSAKLLEGIVHFNLYKGNIAPYAKDNEKGDLIKAVLPVTPNKPIVDKAESFDEDVLPEQPFFTPSCAKFTPKEMAKVTFDYTRSSLLVLAAFFSGDAMLAKADSNKEKEAFSQNMALSLTFLAVIAAGCSSIIDNLQKREDNYNTEEKNALKAGRAPDHNKERVTYTAIGASMQIGGAILTLIGAVSGDSAFKFAGPALVAASTLFLLRDSLSLKIRNIDLRNEKLDIEKKAVAPVSVSGNFALPQNTIRLDKASSTPKFSQSASSATVLAEIAKKEAAEKKDDKAKSIEQERRLVMGVPRSGDVYRYDEDDIEAGMANMSPRISPRGDSGSYRNEKVSHREEKSKIDGHNRY
jgi:hypothetical protein